MTLDFSLTIVAEGTSKLIVPADHSSSGPSSSKMPVFYNPQMEFSRDFSVALLSHLLHDGDSFQDGLAAAGSRGIRVAHECNRNIALHLNDLNQKSIELIRKNLELNHISEATVTGIDLRQLLLSETFDCLDIDPFGTPAPFFPMAVGAVRNRGILCVTATDTGSISGIFQKACLRKYGCKAGRTPFPHEMGVRNLLGFIAREAAKLDVGISPIASYYADHYVRTFLRINRGAKESDKTLEKLGFCIFDSKNLDRAYVNEYKAGAFGPIWIEETNDPGILNDMNLPRNLGTSERIVSLRDLLISESRINRPFFDIDEFARKLKVNPLKMDLLISRLNENAIATKTHYGPKTFSTSSSVDEIIKAFS